MGRNVSVSSFELRTQVRTSSTTDDAHRPRGPKVVRVSEEAVGKSLSFEPGRLDGPMSEPGAFFDGLEEDVLTQPRADSCAN